MANAITRASAYVTAKAQPLSIMPASIGQQVFALVPGVAGGLAGFLLAYRLANTRRVRTAPVILVSLAIAIITISAIFLINPAPEPENLPPA
jgi:cellobiose-specific phosphotransferase system component IIC